MDTQTQVAKVCLSHSLCQLGTFTWGEVEVSRMFWNLLGCMSFHLGESGQVKTVLYSMFE